MISRASYNNVTKKITFFACAVWGSDVDGQMFGFIIHWSYICDKQYGPPWHFFGNLHYDLKLFWEFEWSMYFWRPSSHVGRCISPKVMFGAVVGWWFQSFQWGTDHKGFCFLQLKQTISTNSAHSGKKRCCSHTWPRRNSDVAMGTQVIENVWPK